MSISSQIRASEVHFKLTQKVVTALSTKFSFSFDDAWAELSNKNVDSLTKMFRKERRRNDPLSQVKKPRTSFSFFTQEFRPKVQTANPKASFGDLSRLVSVEWKKITDSDRIRFKGMETSDKERYQVERARVMAELASAVPATETATAVVEAPVADPVPAPAPTKAKRSAKSAKPAATKTVETPAPVATPTPSPTKATTTKKASATKPAAKRARATPKATAQTV